MTRKTTLLLFLLCGLTGGLLAVIQNRTPASGTQDTTGSKAGATKSRLGPAISGKQNYKPASYRFGDEWSGLMEEGRMLTSKNGHPPSYYLYDGDGAISDEGIAAAGLTGDQAREIKSAMEEARDTMFRFFAEGAELDKRKPKDKVDEIWYRIPNQLERGARVFEELQKKFEVICGKEKSEELVRSMNPAFCYANFGRQDVSLRWSHRIVNGQEQWEAEVHCYDAPTGQEVTGMLIRTPEVLKKRFGDGVPWPGN